MTSFEVIDYLLSNGRNIENVLFEKNDAIIYLNSGEKYRIKTNEISLNFLLKKLNNERDRIIKKQQELESLKFEKLTKLIIIILAIILVFALYGSIVLVNNIFTPVSLLTLGLSVFGEYVLLGSIKKSYDEYKIYSNKLRIFIEKDEKTKINQVIKNFNTINVEIEKRRTLEKKDNSFQNINSKSEQSFVSDDFQKTMQMKKIA